VNDLSEEEGSSYWYSLMEQGRDLDGVQLEWATAYKTQLLNAEREALHLDEAARLGWPDARLDLALEKAARNYGYPRLVDLFAAIDLFEMKRANHHPQIRYKRRSVTSVA